MTKTPLKSAALKTAGLKTDLGDLNAFVAVARAGGFRDGARVSGGSASGLSEAVRRLEMRLGVRLLNRTTRSVQPTEAGQRLLERLRPALSEVESALDVVNSFRDRPAGTLRLNVPSSAARLVLPAIVPPFLAAYPEIRLEVIADENHQAKRRRGSMAYAHEIDPTARNAPTKSMNRRSMGNSTGNA